MGGAQSKSEGSGVRRQLELLVPRSWPELEQLHLRFQQEVHRRKSDPFFQYFLPFPVFHIIVAPLCPTKDKTQLLALFALLDRKHARKLAVVDFFSGLALLVDAKKSQKLEFLLSLLDNGGLKTLNKVELTMVLSAASRGLAMFAPGATAAPQDSVLKPLIRRLFGEESEILRQTVVDKALADPEILFFMNDLEAGAATSSDELLVQQAKLMRHMAYLDMQFARVRITEERSKASVVALPSGVKRLTAVQRAPSVVSLPTVEGFVRKLQSLVTPLPPKGTGGSSQSMRTLMVMEAKKHVDVRTLQRLVRVISDGALSLSSAEAQKLVKEMTVDQFGLARCGDIARVLKTWLQNSQQEKPEAMWELLAEAAVGFVRRSERNMRMILTALTARAKKILLPSSRRRTTVAKGRLLESLRALARIPDAEDGELTWNVSIRVGHSDTSASGTVAPPKDSTSSSKRASSSNTSNTIKFRLGIHPPQTNGGSKEAAAAAVIRPSGPKESRDEDDSFPDEEYDSLESSDDEPDALTLAIHFTLRPEISDEESIDLASSVERALKQEQVWAPLSSLWTTCQVTVGSSLRSDGGVQPTMDKYLRVCVMFRNDFLADVEECIGTSLSAGIRSCFVLGELDLSLEELVEASLDVAAVMRGLTKKENRDSAMRMIFDAFDADQSGDWSLQEFNTFQQALGKEALSELTLTEVFAGASRISFAQFVTTYEHCSVAELLEMVQKLGIGSLNDLVKGSLSLSAVLYEPCVKTLETLLTPLRWGDALWKKLLFFMRSTKDLNLELQFPRLAALVQYYSGGTDLFAFLNDPLFVASWVERLDEFVQPTHAEHSKDKVCRSIFCSLEREVNKTQQQWEFDDQSRGLPRGTSARRASGLPPFLELATLVKANVRGPEMLEICSSSLRVVCEVDNLWMARSNSNSSSNQTPPAKDK